MELLRGFFTLRSISANCCPEFALHARPRAEKHTILQLHEREDAPISHATSRMYSNQGKYLFHSLGLGSSSDSGHRETDVDSRSNTLVEQLRLEEDLSISNGDHVGGNVCGYITGLG